MGDVKVPAKRHGKQRVANDETHDAGTQNNWQEEELYTVHHDKEREESIAMYVKGIQPLHGLLHVRPSDGGQVPIGDLLPHRGHDGPDADKVDQHRFDGESHDRREEVSLGRPERHAVRQARHEEQADLHDGEGRVVPGPVILGLLAIVRRLVDALRLQPEEGPALVQRRLKVHGGRLQQPAEVVGGRHRIGADGERRGGGRRRGRHEGDGLGTSTRRMMMGNVMRCGGRGGRRCAVAAGYRQTMTGAVVGSMRLGEHVVVVGCSR